MEVKLGDRIRALRSHNKAVTLTGVVEALTEHNTAVMRLDENQNWLETVYLADVVEVVEPTPAAEEKPAETPAEETAKE